MEGTFKGGVFGFLISLVLSLILTGVLTLFTPHLSHHHHSPYVPWGLDDERYEAMAEGEPMREAPMAWRVLTPRLAGLLGQFLGTEGAFYAVAFAATVGTGVALFGFLRALGFGNLSYLGIAAFYSMYYGPRFWLFDFWLSDPLAACLLAAAAWAAVAERDGLFAILVLIGAFNKETAVFALALFYGLRASRPVDESLLIRTAFLGLPAVAALAALHLYVPVKGGYSYTALLPSFLAKRWAELSLANVVHLTAGAVTAVVFGLALFALARPFGRALTLRFAPLLGLAYAQLLFAEDDQRVVAGVAFLAAIPLALEGAREVAAAFEVHPTWFAPLFATLFALSLTVSMPGSYTYVTETDAFPIALQSLLLLASLAALLALGKRRVRNGAE